MVCVDLQNGQIRWNVPVLHGTFPIKHEKASHAAATPVCDGELAFAAFAVDDAVHVVAVTLEGKPVWHTNAGPFVSQCGYGSSPAVYRSLLIVNAESRGAKLGRIRATSFLAGLDRRTGQMIWRIRRPEEHGFGTPVIARIAARDQLILSGGGRIESYDPASGRLIWTCRSDTQRSANTAAFDDQNVYVSGRFPSDEIICIRADGEGDVSDTHILWKLTRGAAEVPSPVLYEGRLYVLEDAGILNCIDSASGATLWRRRLTGSFSASPIIAGGRLYAVNEAGATSVLELDPAPRVIAENELNEPAFASPTPCGSSLLIRTTRCLRKIGHAIATE